MIVGLGNPGPEYSRTRHNAGFWFIDALAEKYQARWGLEKKLHAESAKIMVAGQSVHLLKPATFMNHSGRAVLAALQYWKLEPSQCLLAHDELDLAPFKVKVKHGGGTAGHNGLKDTQAKLTTADFWRLRIGIGHPRSLQLEQDVADFVLHPPRREEQAAIDEALERAESIVELLAEGRFEAAMLRLHTRPGGTAPQET